MAVVISVARDIGLLDVSDENCPFDDFKWIYDLAYDMHLKGCATFRPNPVTGIVLSEAASGDEAPHCCALEREAD